MYSKLVEEPKDYAVDEEVKVRYALHENGNSNRTLDQNESEPDSNLFENSFTDALVQHFAETFHVMNFFEWQCLLGNSMSRINNKAVFFTSPNNTRKKSLSARKSRNGPVEKLKGWVQNFKGTIVDTGAAKLCIGLWQAKAYMALYGVIQTPSKPRINFRSADCLHKSRGVIQISLPKPIGRWIRFDCDIVSVDVPLLSGLDEM